MRFLRLGLLLAVIAAVVAASAAFLPGLLSQLGTPTPSVPAGSIRIVEADGEALYMESGQLPARLQSNTSLPIRPGGTLQTLEGTLQFILPDSSKVYLDRFSKVVLAQIADPHAEERNNLLTLEQGRLLIVYSPPGGFSSSIAAPGNLRAQVLGSLLGASYDPTQARLEVDCLEGACRIANARDVLSLNGGQYSWAETGTFGPVDSARYFLWSGLGDRDPAWITPTPQPTATTTSTPTATRKYVPAQTTEAPPSGGGNPNPTTTPAVTPTEAPTVEPPTEAPTEPPPAPTEEQPTTAAS